MEERVGVRAELFLHLYFLFLSQVKLSGLVLPVGGVFENEICSHLSEKASKGTFVKPEKLQNHSKEGKGKEKKKERGEGKEERKEKSKGYTLSFYNSYFGDSFWPKKFLTQKVHLAITLLKIRLDIRT